METVRLIAPNIPGVLIESGTWRGGYSMAMLLAQGETASPGYHDNCTVSHDQLLRDNIALGFSEGKYFVQPGWFADTLPPPAARLGGAPIALFRLDGDWYDSTLLRLCHLELHVATEDTVLIDDYYAWDGCARAVHDYLAAGDHAYRIKSVAEFCGAYFTKRPACDRYAVL